MIPSSLATLAFTLLSAVEYPYWIDPCKPEESGCHEGDPQLAQWALESWARDSGGALKFIQAASRRDAVIRVSWVSQRAGLYGEARPITVNGRRGAELYVRPEMEGLGEEIAVAAKTDELLRDAIVFLTCVHEAGHALGLGHTSDFQDIMYSFGHGGDITEYFRRYRRKLQSRNDIPRQSGTSAGDRSRLKALLQ